MVAKLVLVVAFSNFALPLLFSAEPIVATVNGDVITASQLDTALRPQLQAMEDRIRQMRQSTLNKLIDNLLLEQAARGESISVDEYLAKRVESVSVPAAEVDRAYDQSRDQFRGVLPAEAKYRIRRTLEDNARAGALSNLLTALRQKAQVTNMLMAGIAATLHAAAQEGPSLGSADATVTILEFSDFECPYCRAAQPVLTSVIERWPGHVRRVFKHFPLEQHPHAVAAARASICADRQGQFWPMHDRIFAAGSELNEDFLRSAAAASGLNLGEFDSCMRNDETAEHVRKDVLIGRTAGVTGTPALFVNGQPIGSPAALEAAVEKILGGPK